MLVPKVEFTRALVNCMSDEVQAGKEVGKYVILTGSNPTKVSRYKRRSVLQYVGEEFCVVNIERSRDTRGAIQ